MFLMAGGKSKAERADRSQQGAARSHRRRPVAADRGSGLRGLEGTRPPDNT